MTTQWWRSYDAGFQYDLAGRMTHAITSQVTRQWTYDLAGRPAGHTRTGSGGDFTYGYDVANNLTSVNHGGGVVAYYAWDVQSRMTGASLSVSGTSVGSAAIAYDTLGRRTGLGFGDGSYQGYAWELDGDLGAIGHAYPNDASDDVTFGYAHDRIGRVVTEQIDHAAYDFQAPIDSAAYGAVTAINTYPSVDAVTFEYVDPAGINPHALTSDGAVHVALPWRYRHDGHGVLRNAATNGYQNQTSYYPDALGERWYTVHYDTPTTGTRTYVLGPLPDERLIYRAADGQVYYPHTDRRGSIVALSQGGQAAETYAYDEFGQGGPTGASGYPFRYTGQRLDPWTGLYHYKARDYSPNLGRFIQPDPARFVVGPNVYAYVGNNAWNATDPTGLECQGIGNSVSCRVDIFIIRDADGREVERIPITDAVRERLSPELRGRLERFESQLAEAVAQVDYQAENGNLTVQIGPENSDDRIAVSASDSRDAMLGRRIDIDFGFNTSSAYAHAGRPGAYTFAGDFWNIPDPGRTFVHESIHKTPLIQTDQRIWGWQRTYAHDSVFDRAADELRGRPR